MGRVTLQAIHEILRRNGFRSEAEGGALTYRTMINTDTEVFLRAVHALGKTRTDSEEHLLKIKQVLEDNHVILRYFESPRKDVVSFILVDGIKTDPNAPPKRTSGMAGAAAIVEEVPEGYALDEMYLVTAGDYKNKVGRLIGNDTHYRMAVVELPNGKQTRVKWSSLVEAKEDAA